MIELIADELRVLGQPLRLRLIDYLEPCGETNAQGLADDLGATQQNVSRHLGILHQAGVVARRQRDGRPGTSCFTIATRSAWSRTSRSGPSSPL
ncbi:MAG: helix-turn-helix transcriptional regulator [Thermoleophilaceae bacterium]|nr:helix-turn-helix transcriptional regulator [Thermoleophilaceae bacterium]